MLFQIGFVLILSQYIYGINNCNILGDILYETSGCEPVFAATNATSATTVRCPMRYDCPSFELSPHHCPFRSVKVNVGDVLDDNLTSSMGLAICECRSDWNGINAGFHCISVDCPGETELLPTSKPSCYKQYELNECGFIITCPSQETRTSLAECRVGDETFLEGQKFPSPFNPCVKCVCQSGFNASYTAPFCQSINCTDQIFNANEFQQKCAPAYYAEEETCCPRTWICPDGQENITQFQQNSPTTFMDSNDVPLKCSYGDKELKLGEGFIKETELFDENITFKCQCNLPPLVTCLSLGKK